MSEHEPITIVVSARDRFSTAAACLSNIFKHTRGDFSVAAVFGGMPDSIRRDLEAKFSDRVHFTFKPELISNAQARNLALFQIKTRLSVFLDTDVFVRSGWVEPLIACQKETGASLVAPLVLDRQNMIHTAGNDLYVFRELGKNYAKMELRYKGQPAGLARRLTRSEVDFCEVHCQLFETETAKQLRVFDENLREGHEMDSGLTLRQAGRKMMVEPKSVVYLHYPERIDDAADLLLYLWKWEPKAMEEGFTYFQKKWGMNINYKKGFSYYLKKNVYPRVGYFSRRSQTAKAVKADMFFFRVKKKLSKNSIYQFINRVVFEA